MAGYSSNNVINEIIQQILDDNKGLLLNILDNQNSGNMDEFALNQDKVRQNLIKLAAIADGRSQGVVLAQQPQSSMMVQNQQAQQMASQSQIYPESPLSLMLQQQQATPLQSQPQMNFISVGRFSMCGISRSGCGGGTGQLTMLRRENNDGGYVGGMNVYMVQPRGRCSIWCDECNGGGFSRFIKRRGGSSGGRNNVALTDFTLGTGSVGLAMPNPGPSAEEQTGSSGGEGGNGALPNFVGGPEEGGN